MGGGGGFCAASAIGVGDGDVVQSLVLTFSFRYSLSFFKACTLLRLGFA